MDKQSKIYIAGHTGMAGSAILRLLKKSGYSNIITPSSSELDLRRQSEVELFFKQTQPEFVFLCAAKVGGIHANDIYRAEFIYDNLMISANVIHSSYLNSVKKLLYLGSSCVYPKFAQQPISEESLLTGALEQTNEPYAIAKIAGLKLVENYNRQYKTNYISAMPTNLYGLNDNYHPDNSHVMAALIKKFVEAKINHEKSVTLWGDGSPYREFLFVDDLAEACVYLMDEYQSNEIINVGSGDEIQIKDLAKCIMEVLNYSCKIEFDIKKPNGTPRKVNDSNKIKNLGWKAKTELKEGIKVSIQDFYNKFYKGQSN